MTDPLQLLRDHFGFDSFREGQRAVIDALLAGNSALAVFPTGAGKSLCYQLPALALEGVTLVVSPLIALMKDQIDFLTKRGIAAARLDSSLTEAELRDVTNRARNGSLRLLYVAPERFNNERFLALLEGLRVAIFAVDEAHCISEWGHNFRPDYLKLAETAKSIRAERVLALTATATPSVVADIRAAFDIDARNTVLTGFYRKNLTLLTTATRASERDGLLIARLRERPPGPTLVYVTLQHTAERVAGELMKAGLPARAYHAGMESTDRAAVQDWWQRSDAAIVVATIAFGMGIDKSNVRYVYHYNVPKSLEGYMQEIGRAGRDGQPATLELFAALSDLAALEAFSYGDTPTEASLRRLVSAMLAMPEQFDVSLYELSGQFDIRPLVLRTALTYLELDGALRQGTPFYEAYEARVLGRIPADLEPILARAKKGRTWLTFKPDDMAASLGLDRTRIVRALEQAEQQGSIELRTAGARLRFTRLAQPSDAARLAEKLVERFLRREALAIGQLKDVIAVVTANSCQSNALVGHFGEKRESPCGHCSFCLKHVAQEFPPEPPRPPIARIVDRESVQRLAAAERRALGEPRQIARFLCGLTSPATTSAKLTKHPLFRSLEDYPFSDVLAFCVAAAEEAPQAPAYP
jgi:ATP-dependent DNA helicase RecQ